MNYHKMSTSDCVNLFNAWLLEDANQIGDIYDRVEKFTDNDEVRHCAPDIDDGEMGAFRFALRAFLAGFFIGQDDGIKLMEAVSEKAMIEFLGQTGDEASASVVMDKVSQELESGELTISTIN